ncbi:MAG: hypothetical protein JWO31_2242 [Phycisphaerales bacterium]|nr:hypothetical protein [Phycisphaerales bacterium]
MYEDPNEYEEPSGRPDDAPSDPAARAREKADELRAHAERAAVFEGHRKFDARLIPGLDADLARDVQRRFALLERSRSPESPVLPAASAADAAALLALPEAGGPTTNDYHIRRRPGEVLMVRWLAGEQVETFYARAQAHFDAAIEGYREDEQQSHGWKQDPKTAAYLKALETVDVRMADRYLRDPIKQHGLFVLSTQAADELDVLHLSDVLMGVSPADVVGAASAPPDDGPTEQDRAWYYKLFSLRGAAGGVERMCFFTYLQKADDSFDFD